MSTATLKRELALLRSSLAALTPSQSAALDDPIAWAERIAGLSLDPWQRGSFALHAPGQIGFIDVLGKAEGRIHFAGEHTSAWTGWMQGALESARRVVAEITGTPSKS